MPEKFTFNQLNCKMPLNFFRPEIAPTKSTENEISYVENKNFVNKKIVKNKNFINNKWENSSKNE